MLAILKSVLRAVRAAVNGIVDGIAAMVAGILGGGSRLRPPAALPEPPVSRANPIGDNLLKLDRNARKVLRWASDNVMRGRAQVPTELPQQIRQCEGLSRDEIEKLVIAGLSRVRDHLAGAPLAGVMPIGSILQREVRPQEPALEPELGDAAYVPR